jgi:hypothetical protein
LCPILNEPGLAWDYEVDPGAPRPPLYFKIIKVLHFGSGEGPFNFTTSDGTHMSAPQDSDCGRRAYYQVKAVVGFDPVSGAEIVSGYSVPFGVPATCGTLEITLEYLTFNYVDDGPFDSDYEAYGSFMFNGTQILWNKDCDGYEFCGGAPRYTVVDTSLYTNMADMSLNIAGGRLYARGNNVIRVPVRDGQALNWNFRLWDHDDGSADDLICKPGRDRSVLPPLPVGSLAEWLSVDYEYFVRGDHCDIYIYLRGIPGTP